MPISQDPCPLRPELNALGVEVLIIGVGQSWNAAKLSCLVQSEENDIIFVDGFNNDAFGIIRNQTDEFLCRDVSFLMSEIKPFGDIPFVEFFNNVKDLDLAIYDFQIEGTFNGKIAHSLTNQIHSVYGNLWPYGTYLVLFDDSNNNIPWCYECICDLIAPLNRLCNESIYILCDGLQCEYNTKSTVNDWRIAVYDRTIPQTSRLIMDIYHGMGQTEHPWITIDEGYTYELRDKDVCPSTFGSCWEQSCTVHGTPGSEPIDCNICLDQNCQTGGDPNAKCNEETNLCDCTEWCYNIHGVPSCNCLTPPLNCTIILQSDLDGTGIPSGDASWNTPEIDWSAQDSHYTLWYEVRWSTFQNDEHNERIAQTGNNQRSWTLFNMEYRNPSLWPQEVRTVVDFGDNPNTRNITDHEIHSSEWTLCKLQTMAPTFSPTPAPTLGLPPIDRCNVSIRPEQLTSNGYITIDVGWSEADLSAMNTFDQSQFNNDYKLYFTQMDVYIPGTDNLAMTAYKVRNNLIYSETLSNYNASQLIFDDALQIKVSVVVHKLNDSSVDLDDLDASFDDLMYEQATICQWHTFAPTASPTLSPSVSPTFGPSNDPTKEPTASPTYSWWKVEECVIKIMDIEGKNWIISWLESDPLIDENLPNQRIIYVMMDGKNEVDIMGVSTFSPQNIIVTMPLTADSMVELIVMQQTIGSDTGSYAQSPFKTVCKVQTMNPTQFPTSSPSTSLYTHSPTLSPSKNPSLQPTQSPTIVYPPIEWCNILILEQEQYEITFKVPKYDNIGSPPLINTKYVIHYDKNGENSVLAETVGSDLLNYTNSFSTTNGVRLNGFTNFQITSMSLNELNYAKWTDCNVYTLSPTLSPSIVPTINPTLSPTLPKVGAFVYSDDDTLCSGEIRCACSIAPSNYDCVGSNFPELEQIEDDRLIFLTSDGVQKKVLLVGRYPKYFQQNVEIKWKFEYLNDSDAFDYGQRIKPIQGKSIIYSGKELGEIIFAEFVPMPSNENEVRTAQWYKFVITDCQTIGSGTSGCAIIYPSWAYVIWIPREAFRGIILDGAEPWPDWIFYLLLGGSVTVVAATYFMFVFFKNNNLKNNEAAQNLHAEAMLKGINADAHIVTH